MRNWVTPLLLVDQTLSDETRFALHEAWFTTEPDVRQAAQRKAAALLRQAFPLTCDEIGELVGYECTR